MITQNTDNLPNIHPGDALREDYLQPLNKSAYWLAKGIRMSSIAVSEILNGKRDITPNTALRLSRFLGASPQFWLYLQAAYDLEERSHLMTEELNSIQRSDLIPA